MRQRYVLECSRFLFHGIRRRTRSFSSISSATLSNRLLVEDPDSTVLVERNAGSRTVVLNRPSFLNTLTTPMLNRLLDLYERWEDAADVGFLVMKGRGRAFSAGGDIVIVHDMMKTGDIEEGKELIRRLYNFIYTVHTYAKPHVAILNGITMGAGTGISIPGTFRVATDKTVFALPETLVGFHVDVGASFHLSHLPGHLGEYLALTGAKLNGVEMVELGLATHYLRSSNVPLLEEHLKNLITDDPSVIKTSLENYRDLDYLKNAGVIRRMETINKCFGHGSVEEIIDALETEAARTKDGWCDSILKQLRYASPLSLKVTLRSMREGRFQTFEECLIREYRMTLQAMACQISPDFREGVRARLVDKDFAPKWNPSSLEHVSKDMVDGYFSPLSPHEPDLELPKRNIEEFHTQIQI